MVDTAIIHIGMFKSGSTAIRELLYKNRELLVQNDYMPIIDSYYKGSHFLLNEANLKPIMRSIYLKYFLKSAIHTSPISYTNSANIHMYTSEFLSQINNPSRISILSKYKNRIGVLVARDQFDLRSKLISELLLDTNYSFSLSYYLSSILCFDYSTIINNWSNYCDLKIINYDTEILPNFLDIINFEGSGIIYPSVSHNKSLPLSVVEFLYTKKKKYNPGDFKLLIHIMKKDYSLYGFPNYSIRYKDSMDKWTSRFYNSNELSGLEFSKSDINIEYNSDKLNLIYRRAKKILKYGLIDDVSDLQNKKIY